MKRYTATPRGASVLEQDTHFTGRLRIRRSATGLLQPLGARQYCRVRASRKGPSLRCASAEAQVPSPHAERLKQAGRVPVLARCS